MKVTIGIDVGGSTTKIVGLYEESMKITKTMQVKAADPLTSIYGAFGKFLSASKTDLSSIERVVMTGVGSSHVTSPIYNLPTFKISEFLAIGLGGLYLSLLDKAIIVSMGTGTSFVRADGINAKHLGGTGIGGGLLMGLSKLMLNVQNVDTIFQLAQEGDLTKVDLTVQDISKEAMQNLPPYVTAANFGNISDNVEKTDISKGIINAIFQSIGMMAVFAAKSYNEKNIVLSGNLAQIPDTFSYFEMLEQLHNVKFTIPENAEFVTAVGSAIAHSKKAELKRV